MKKISKYAFLAWAAAITFMAHGGTVMLTTAKIIQQKGDVAVDSNCEGGALDLGDLVYPSG